MAIPSNFGHVEHVQAVIRRVLNKQVIADFRDLGDKYWEESTVTARGSMRVALTHRDNDPLSVTLARMMLYYFVFGKARKLQPTIIGQIKDTYDESNAYKCQVQLFFQQDHDATPQGRYPVRAEISFRIDATHETITENKCKTLASRIKTEFNTSGGYRWSKGRVLCLYTDKARGYNLQIYALNATVGETLIKKILDIQNHPFEPESFRHTTPKRKSENNPTGIIRILKKSYKKPRWRPTAYVRFARAELIVWNRAQPITLIDNTGLRDRAIIA